GDADHRAVAIGCLDVAQPFSATTLGSVSLPRAGALFARFFAFVLFACRFWLDFVLLVLAGFTAAGFIAGQFRTGGLRTVRTEERPLAVAVLADSQQRRVGIGHHHAHQCVV